MNEWMNILLFYLKKYFTLLCKYIWKNIENMHILVYVVSCESLTAKCLLFSSFVIRSTECRRTHHVCFFLFSVANYPLVLSLSLILLLSLCRQSSVRYMMFRLHDTSELQSPGRRPHLPSFPLLHCLHIQDNAENAASSSWMLVSRHRNAACAHFKSQGVCTHMLCCLGGLLFSEAAWWFCFRVHMCLLIDSLSVWACGESHMFPACSPGCLLTWPLPWEQSDSGRLCTDVLGGFTEQVSERLMPHNTQQPSNTRCVSWR